MIDQGLQFGRFAVSNASPWGAADKIWSVVLMLPSSEYVFDFASMCSSRPGVVLHNCPRRMRP